MAITMMICLCCVNRRAILTRFEVKSVSPIDHPILLTALPAVRNKLRAVRGNDSEDSPTAAGSGEVAQDPLNRSRVRRRITR